MKKIYLGLIITFLFVNSFFAQEKPVLSKGKLVKISPPIKNIANNIDESKLFSIYDKTGRKIWPKNIAKPYIEFPKYNLTNDYKDPLVTERYSTDINNSQLQILQGLDGLETGVSPMDPDIAVGNNYVIELVNAAPTTKMRIWDKQGNVLINGVNLQSISGFPGYGDPIAMYDKFNDRYIVTEFMIKNHNQATENGLIIMVSQNGDPTSSWYVYKWVLNDNYTLDYPKWAVGPDGIYVHTNNFSQNPSNLYSQNNQQALSSFTGSFFIVFNKNELYSGNSTFRSMRISQNNGNIGVKYSTCPVQIQGDLLPNTGQLFVGKQTNGQTIYLTETNVDWNNYLFSQQVVANINLASYYNIICPADRNRCIHQKNSTSKLEALAYYIMNQPKIKVTSNYTGLIYAFTVNVGNNTAGIRWGELVKQNNNWSLRQESTIASGQNYEHYFMPAISYDNNDNILLAYNTSGVNTYPSINVNGRFSTDPLNQMTLGNNDLKLGNSYVGTINGRFGDYNDLVLDPADGSLWMVAMYGKNNALRTSGTFVSNFTLSNCLSDIVITDDVLSQTIDNQSSSNTITATNTIFNNATANYTAGNVVYLKPGFNAKTGSNFRAWIEGCSSTSTRPTMNFENDEFILSKKRNDPEIMVYPNPADKNILVNVDDKDFKTGYLSIYDMFGNLKLKKKIQKTNRPIDISSLKAGLYLLKVSSKDKIYKNVKLIVN